MKLSQVQFSLEVLHPDVGGGSFAKSQSLFRSTPGPAACDGFEMETVGSNFVRITRGGKSRLVNQNKVIWADEIVEQVPQGTQKVAAR